MKNKLPLHGLGLFKKHAERVARDPAAAARLFDEAISKAAKHEGALAQILDDVKSLLRLLKAALTGRYKTVPWSSVMMALAAVIYFVNPLDIVPDFIIGAGMLDDLTVLAFVLNALKGDLSTFRDWEKTST